MMQIPSKPYFLLLALAVLCASCANTSPVSDVQADKVSVAEKRNKITADEQVLSHRQNRIFKERLELVDQKQKYVVQLQRLPAIERVSNSALRIKIQTLEAQIQALDLEYRKPFVFADNAGKYQPYLDTCVAGINQYGSDSYPAEARGKLYGRASVSFHVLANGEIRRLKIIRGTGHKVLDDALIDAVVNASPCQPFPSWMGKELDYLVVVAPFEFSNNDEN